MDKKLPKNISLFLNYNKDSKFKSYQNSTSSNIFIKKIILINQVTIHMLAGKIILIYQLILEIDGVLRRI